MNSTSTRRLLSPFIICMLLQGFQPMAQQVMQLYSDSIPNSIASADEETASYTDDSILVISNISRPTLTVYLPPKGNPTGTAVVICPGGGYWIVAAGHEGSDVARRLNNAGIAAIVVKYRIPNEKTMIDPSIGPLQDAQRAIQLVRMHAKQWGINKNRVGIMGFSAGGHLAASAGTHFNRSFIPNPQNINLRPDFMVLVYPVISFTDSIGHMGSRDQLIGKNPPVEKIKYYSNELQVGPRTPAAFLVHAKDDDVVNVENSILFAAALDKYHTPERVFYYEHGGHGFGLHNKTSERDWIDSCIKWIFTNKWKK